MGILIKKIAQKYPYKLQFGSNMLNAGWYKSIETPKLSSTNSLANNYFNTSNTFNNDFSNNFANQIGFQADTIESPEIPEVNTIQPGFQPEPNADGSVSGDLGAGNGGGGGKGKAWGSVVSGVTSVASTALNAIGNRKRKEAEEAKQEALETHSNTMSGGIGDIDSSLLETYGKKNDVGKAMLAAGKAGAAGAALATGVLATTGAGAAVTAAATAAAFAGGALFGGLRQKKLNKKADEAAELIEELERKNMYGRRNFAKNASVSAANSALSMAKNGLTLQKFHSLIEDYKPEKFKAGGKMNIIPKGKLHKENNNLGNKDKGIPVVDKNGKKVYELEKEEFVLNAEASDKLNKLYAEYQLNPDDKLLLAIGSLMKEEMLGNTTDKTNKFLVE